MRKIQIAEIENSFLNFFTPAIIIATGYFLFNFIGWIVLFLTDGFLLKKFPLFSSLANSLLTISFFSLASIFVYLIFTSKLKIRHAEYKEVNKINFIITLLSTFLLIGFYFFLMIFAANFIFKMDNNTPQILSTGKTNWNFNWNNDLGSILDMIAIIFKITEFNLIHNVFFGIIYIRSLIPLLEDRGCSSFLSIILAAIGRTLIHIPINIVKIFYYNEQITHETILVDLNYFILYSFLAVIYIMTRNILYPYLLQFLYIIYDLISYFAFSNNIVYFKIIYNTVNFMSISIFLIFILYIIYTAIYKKILPSQFRNIKFRSAPYLKRGIIGFFVISLGLLLIQSFVVVIGRVITSDLIFPNYFTYIIIFYFFAFSIPFWFTLNTEYALDS